MAIEYIHRALFDRSAVKKNLIIAGDNFAIDNSDIFSESMNLHEPLNTEEELIFGSCESACFKVTINNSVFSLTGKKINVSLVLDNDIANPFEVGHYTVVSDIPTADTNKRELTCYDDLYFIINSDVAVWYQELRFPMRLKDFRDSFFNYLGVEQDTYTLANDDLLIEKTIDPEELSGAEVIQRICEINGCFGHIGRNGKFQYITLEEPSEGLYPSNSLYPADDLFPRSLKAVAQSLTGRYYHCRYEDYTVKKINKLQIRENEDDIGAIVGTGTNAYVVENNFLVYGKNAADLQAVAANMFEVIRKVEYRPIDIEAMANPCMEVGDIIHIVTSEEIINTYILDRTIKGIQTLIDNIYADGYPERLEQIYSTNYQFEQLKRKTNELVRNVDETRSTLRDLAEGTESEFLQTAQAIAAKVDSVRSNSSFGWELTATGFSIKSSNTEVFKANSSGIEVKGKITAESGYIGNGTSGFTIGSTAIYNGINSISATTGTGVYIGTDGFNLGGGKFKVNSDGTLSAKKGEIGGFTIGSSSLYNNTNSYASTSEGIYIGTDGINLGGKFKVSKKGEISINSTGSLEFVNSRGSSYGRMQLDSNGISFGDNSFYVTVNSDTITNRYAQMKSDEFLVHSAYSGSTYYTSIKQGVINFGSASGGRITCNSGAGGITLDNSNGVTIKGTIKLSGSLGGSSYRTVMICDSAYETLSFFGATGQKKQTFPSSGTLTNLVNILKGYGLIG